MWLNEVGISITNFTALAGIIGWLTHKIILVKYQKSVTGAFEQADFITDKVMEKVLLNEPKVAAVKQKWTKEGEKIPAPNTVVPEDINSLKLQYKDIMLTVNTVRDELLDFMEEFRNRVKKIETDVTELKGNVDPVPAESA